MGEDTTLAQIIQMVSDAAATKAPIAKMADTVSGVFVPAVIAIAVVTTIVWLLLGQSMGFALARGISVLVISCPCALGLATPVAIMVGNGMGAKNGILFKTAASLEATGQVQIVALDKTGTITSGEPSGHRSPPGGGRDRERAADPGRLAGAEERAPAGEGRAGRMREDRDHRMPPRSPNLRPCPATAFPPNWTAWSSSAAALSFIASRGGGARGVAE